MSISPSELAEHIRTARQAKGWTLKECADNAGIGKTAMFDLEHGNPGVRLNTLLTVLDQLGLELQLADPLSPTSSITAKQSEDRTPNSHHPSPATGSPDLPDHLL